MRELLSGIWKGFWAAFDSEGECIDNCMTKQEAEKTACEDGDWIQRYLPAPDADTIAKGWEALEDLLRAIGRGVALTMPMEILVEQRAREVKAAMFPRENNLNQPKE